MDLLGPDFFAVSRPPPLVDVVFHLRGDFEVSAPREEKQRLDLQLFGIAFEEVGHLAPLDNLHLLVDRVGPRALALFGALPAGAHSGNIEKVHLLDDLAPVVVQAVGQHGHDQLEHGCLDRLLVFAAVAASRVVFEDVPAVALAEVELVPGDARETLRGPPFVELLPLAVEQEPHARPVGEDRRVVIAEADFIKKRVDPDKQAGERIPVVPEEPRGGGHVTVVGEWISAHQPAQHGLLGGKAAAVDRAHVGEGVEEVHPPLAIDLSGAVLAPELFEQLFQLGLLPGPLRGLALDVKPAGEHANPLRPGQRADHHRVLGRHAGGDSILGREPGDQGGRLVRSALRIQVVVEGKVLVVGGLAVLLVAPEGAVGFARRFEHLAHEQALSHLRRAVYGRGHGDLRRGIQVARQAAKLEHLEFVALGDRQQVYGLSGGIELGQPVAQVGGQLLDLLGLPDQAAIAFVRKSHRVFPSIFRGVFLGVPSCMAPRRRAGSSLGSTFRPIFHDS